MIYGVYAIRDFKAAFGSIFCDKNDAAAKRGFSFAVNNGPKDSMLGYQPKDFALYRLAEYDDDTGVITTMPIVQLVCNGEDVVDV